jgi:hypothetical protein
MAGEANLIAMNSKANEQVLAALQEVVAATPKGWLDENKAQVLEAIHAVVVERPAPLPDRPAVESREPKFLNTA